MKTIILFLVLAPLFANASEGFVNTSSWVKISCHTDKPTTAFSFTTSNEQLNSVRQIQITELSANIKENFTQDNVSAEQPPIVALALLTQNQIKFSLRYENGLMWDTNLKIDMTRKQGKWQTHIVVEGDEGIYFDENKLMNCRIEASHQIFETTAGY